MALFRVKFEQSKNMIGVKSRSALKIFCKILQSGQSLNGDNLLLRYFNPNS